MLQLRFGITRTVESHGQVARRRRSCPGARSGFVQTLRQLEAGVEVCDVADATSAIEMLDAGRGFDMMLLDLLAGRGRHDLFEHVAQALPAVAGGDPFGL